MGIALRRSMGFLFLSLAASYSGDTLQSIQLLDDSQRIAANYRARRNVATYDRSGGDYRISPDSTWTNNDCSTGDPNTTFDVDVAATQREAVMSTYAALLDVVRTGEDCYVMAEKGEFVDRDRPRREIEERIINNRRSVDV